MLPIVIGDLTDVTITIDGTIKASKRHHKWPTHYDNVDHLF